MTPTVAAVLPAATQPVRPSAVPTATCPGANCAPEPDAVDEPESETAVGLQQRPLQSSVRPIRVRDLDASNDTAYTLWTIPEATLRALQGGGEPGVLWQIPFRSQLDGSLYQQANCGPASLAMVLEAFGVSLPTGILRQAANRLQGSYGYLDGVGIDYLAKIAADSGLEADHLYDGAWYLRWYPDLVRWHVRQGHPVLTLVKYRSLPGNDGARSSSDHYVVITGLVGDSFVYNDPAFVGTAGYGRIISEQGLLFAWDRSDVPRLAVAFRRGTAPRAIGLVRDWTAAAPAVGLGAVDVGGDSEDRPIVQRVSQAATDVAATSVPGPQPTVITWEIGRGTAFLAPTPENASQEPAPAPASAPAPAPRQPAVPSRAQQPRLNIDFMISPAAVVVLMVLVLGLFVVALVRRRDADPGYHRVRDPRR